MINFRNIFTKEKEEPKIDDIEQELEKNKRKR